MSAQERGAEALKVAFPTLTEDFTDEWFTKAARIVLEAAVEYELTMPVTDRSAIGEAIDELKRWRDAYYPEDLDHAINMVIRRLEPLR